MRPIELSSILEETPMPEHQIVDTHVHFWNPAALEYFWLTLSQPLALRRAFMPDELEQQRINSNVQYGVYVQVGHDVRENDWVLEVTRPYPWIRGIAGWLDLSAPNLEPQIERVTKDARFKGVRHLTHAIDDPNWLTRTDVQAGLEIIGDHGLSVDLVLRADQLEMVFEVIAAHPRVTFVLDHMGNPPFNGDLEQWRVNIARLATLPNLCCKISGLLTGFQGAPDLGLLRETIHFGFSVFSMQRVMFGGDWPVGTLAASYPRTIQIMREAVGTLLEPDARALWSDNATRVYRLDLPPA
jgi:L-fuconolactonase